MSSIVTSKGQVTVPKRVRDLQGIGPGSEIDFERAADGRVMLVKTGKKVRPSRFARLRGHAGEGLSPQPSTDGRSRADRSLPVPRI